MRNLNRIKGYGGSLEILVVFTLGKSSLSIDPGHLEMREEYNSIKMHQKIQYKLRDPLIVAAISNKLADRILAKT